MPGDFIVTVPRHALWDGRSLDTPEWMRVTNIVSNLYMSVPVLP